MALSLGSDADPHRPPRGAIHVRHLWVIRRAAYGRYYQGMAPDHEPRQYSAVMERARAAATWLTGIDAWIADGALASLLTVLAYVQVGGPFHNPPSDAWILVATLPLVFRRRHPFAAFAVQFIGLVGAFQENGVATVAAFVIGGYSLGVHARRRALSLLAVAVAALILAIVFGHGDLPPIPAALLPFTLLLPAWLLGWALRVPRLRAGAMHERALRLEREREIATSQAVSAERTRIARELHDVVAHTVSVMVVQAGAARQLLRRSPDSADESLLSVEASGRDALRELRHLLELLGEDGGEPSLTPQPGAAQIGALVDRMVAAGQPVELRMSGEARPLPTGLDLAVYRIVQEALTNALKYARGARTDVLVDYGSDELRLEVVDEGDGAPAPDGTGRGLIGMRQRVEMYGGQLQAGPRPGRGFAVRARLPLDGG
jgi:signal transduction histidine kinase